MGSCCFRCSHPTTAAKTIWMPALLAGGDGNAVRNCSGNVVCPANHYPTRTGIDREYLNRNALILTCYICVMAISIEKGLHVIEHKIHHYQHWHEVFQHLCRELLVFGVMAWLQVLENSAQPVTSLVRLITGEPDTKHNPYMFKAI